ALLEQARLNQIPESAWRKIVSGLAGDQYQVGTPPVEGEANNANITGLKVFHIESGNQNFYSLPVTATASAEELGKRRALIDQLLAVNSNPAAAQVLQNARILLAGTQ